MAAVKALQQWCRLQCEGYRDVSITNMTTSFRDGLAFCALIHRHRPDLINFYSLKKENVYDNNNLAFSVAEQQLGIPALLDAEDMVALRVPDRLSILTYVSQYYNYFHGRSPIGGMAGVKRPAEEATEQQPAGKKNAPVSAKVFPSSGPTKENQPPVDQSRPTSATRHNHRQDVPAERPPQTGTLSSKCVSCNQHVHLVQRHLVEGKLYHRNCAKTLTGNPFTTDRPKNSSGSRLAPPDPGPVNTSAKPGPTWLSHKPNAPTSVSSSTSHPLPANPAPSNHISSVVSPQPANGAKTKTTCTFLSSLAPSAPTTTMTTTTPKPSARTSITSKNLQAKLRFFQSGDGDCGEEDKGGRTGRVEKFGGRKEEEEKPPTHHSVMVVVQEKERSGSKASAAAVISNKLSEENNNKPAWTVSKAKQSSEASRTEGEGVRGRVRLRANPSLLSDLTTSTSQDPKSTIALMRSTSPRSTSPRSTSPRSTSPRSTSPRSTPADSKAASKPKNASPNPSGLSGPSDWRARLKPVSKESRPASSCQTSPKPWTGSSLSQSTDCPRPAPGGPAPSISVTPPAHKGLSTPPKGTALEHYKPKTKADYIPQEEILKELQQIEDSLNELEKTGVELEKKLRTSEEKGEDESVMNELMVDWFTLIRHKQAAMRRESELVYIGRTQELEEKQPTVEQELRRLLDKPDHLKMPWERRREKELMEKLVEIVNDRNAIVEGLDEDRLREEEEDEQLNQLMMSFNLKKDKKKKSPMARLFTWGSSKDT